MKKRKKHISLNGRLGDFLCNFTAVVLGILITFAGSNMIENRKAQNELKDALQLVKNEMILNKQHITLMMKREIFEKNGALYLLEYKNNINQAPIDSLNKYRSFPFQTQEFLCIDDAMEMLKTSSLMSAIKDKELATQIIKTYNAIKGAYETFKSYTENKQKNIDKLVDNPAVKRFLTNDTNYSAAEEWDFYFKFPEGIQLLQYLGYTHDDPQRMYIRFINLIDETVAAIESDYFTE